MCNVHRLFITYIHRTSESRNTKNTYDFLVQVRNFFITFEFKGERYTFFIFWLFHLPTPHLVRHLPKASANKRKSTVFSRGRTQLNSYLFKIPKLLRARSSDVWRHSHPLVNLSIGFLFWHLWTIHPPRASVNTCTQVCTWLTHVLSRKVLSLTKPKGIKRNPSAIILHPFIILMYFLARLE